jgi:hypothetical protein
MSLYGYVGLRFGIAEVIEHTSRERNGQPARVLLISLNKRCSMVFRLEVPVGQ